MRRFRACRHALDPCVAHPGLPGSPTTSACGSTGRLPSATPTCSPRSRSLAAIGCPALVLCRRADALTPVPLHEEMHAGIAGSRLVVLETCGRTSPLDRPHDVTRALRELLAAAPAQ